MRSERGTALVCFAVKEEAAEFKKTLDSNCNIAVLVSGIGKRNAEQALRDFLKTQTPSLILTCGFAGALDPCRKIGDLLFDEDPGLGLQTRLQSLGAVPARFHCADKVAVSKEAKAELRRTTGADAVEMESSTIRVLSRERGIPSATLRAISDIAGEDLPLDFNTLMTPDQKISPGKLAVALVKSPASIPGLVQLHRNTRLAATRLADALCLLLRTGGWDGLH